VGDQFAVGEQNDSSEKRQHIGQRVRVSPMSGRKNTCDVSQLGRDY
jgi:hypothetical protein